MRPIPPSRGAAIAALALALVVALPAIPATPATSPSPALRPHADSDFPVHVDVVPGGDGMTSGWTVDVTVTSALDLTGTTITLTSDDGSLTAPLGESWSRLVTLSPGASTT
ncbi:MAG: malate:quinone oxidoreductase, partial [Halobacteriales archaeon]|nr:malate:quinone oxidoreductase [Halobacteriales archaeon]